MKITLHDGRTYEGQVEADDGDVFDICWEEDGIQLRATIPRALVEMEWEGEDITFNPSPKLRELLDTLQTLESLKALEPPV